MNKRGISAEVVDPRTIVPLDRETLLRSVKKTGHLVIVDETNLSCGVASEISAIVAENGFSSLNAPIVRIARPDVPVPFSGVLEERLTPSAKKIVSAVQSF